MVDTPPTADKLLQPGQRTWEIPEHRPNLTLSRAAFKTYSTYVQHNRVYPVRIIPLANSSSQHPPQDLRLDSRRCPAVNQLAFATVKMNPTYAA